MNNILNGSVTSIERMAEVISKRKKQDVNATYDGPTFTEILSRQQSIDDLVAGADAAEAAAEHRAQRRARNKVKTREPLFPAVPVFSWVFRAERV